MERRAWLRSTLAAAAATLAFASPAVAQQSVVDAYNAYNQFTAAGDQPNADAALAALNAECGALGYGDVNQCVSDAFNPPAQVVEQAPAGPTPEELEAQFQQEVAPALSDYATAINTANGGGDYDQALALGNDAAARLSQICANNGRPAEPAACLGYSLEAFPPRPQPAGPTAREIQQEVLAAFGAYTDAINQVAAGGDYDSAKAAADTAEARLFQVCNSIGRTIGDCLGQEMPVFPERPQVAQGPTQAELDQEFQQLITPLIGDYQSAFDMAARSGDHAKAQARADLAVQQMAQVCAQYNRGPVEQCVGALPPLPQPAAATAGDAGTAAPETPAEPDTAAITAAIQAAYADYMAVRQQATAGGDLATLQPLADEAAGRILSNCQLLGAQSIVDCIQVELPALPVAQAAAGTAAGTAAPETPAELDTAAITAAIQAAYADYMAVRQQATAGGDLATLQPLADEAAGRILTNCQLLGAQSIVDCIQVELPALPDASQQTAAGTDAGGTTATPETAAAPTQRQTIAAIRSAYDDYIAIYGRAVAGEDLATLQPLADEASGRILANCQLLGVQTIVDCIQAELPPLPAAAAAAGTTADGAVTPETSAALTDDERAQLVARGSAAAGAYVEAIASVAAGRDYAAAKADADTALAAVRDVCTALGFATVADCTGSEPQPFPEPPSGTTAAGTAAVAALVAPDEALAAYAGLRNATGDQDAQLATVDAYCREQGYANSNECRSDLDQGITRNNAPPVGGTPVPAQNELTDAFNAYVAVQESLDAAVFDAAQARLSNQCIIAGYPTFEDCVAAVGGATPQPPSDPLAAAEAGIRAAVDLYGKGATRLAAGDASGQADVDAATATLQQSCAPLGFASNEECVANYGLTLPAGGSQVADTAAAIAKLEASRARLEGGAPVLTQAERDALVAKAQQATSDYFAAIEQAKTDYDAALKKGTDARQALSDACSALDDPDLDHCIGRVVPPFPAAGAATVAAAPANSCQYAFDGECDEVGLGTGACTAGTDTNDCRPPVADAAAATAAGANQCQYAFDGECDEVGLGTGACTAGTDTADCRPGTAGPAMSPCQDVNADGVCDQPGTGTAATADATKAAAVADLARAREDYEAGNAAFVAQINAGRPVQDDRVNQDKIATALSRITTACNTIAGSEVINLASPMSALDDCLKANGLPALSTPWHMLAPTLSPEVLANLKMMVGDYNAYAQSTAPFDRDGLQKAIGDYCAANKLGDLKSCLATAGLLLADQSVTTATMEKLPDGTTPTNAAPLLDSAKGDTAGATTTPAAGTPTVATAAPTGGSLATTLATMTPINAPKTDAEAQANLPKVALPATFEPGKTIDPSTVSFTPPKSRPADTKGGGQTGGQRSGGISINLSATITPDGGFVFNLGAQTVISNPEQERRRVFDPKRDRIGYEKLADDRIRETVTRPDGRRVITIRSNTGEVAQRDVVMPSGKSFTLAVGTGPRLPGKAGGSWRDPGDDLPPLRLTISARDYVLDADDAEEDDVAFFLVQPPVERVARIYSVEEVKRSARVRDSVRRLEIGGLSFDSGEATLPRNQYDALEAVADAMLQLLDRDPSETFLIEGHTDAVGTEISNLELSDDRAIEIATILTEEFGIPPENLVTQGYGETYLKVKTDAAERLNRRVTIRRITPLITVASVD